MANSDKNILITPSVGLSTNPTIKFNGANNTPTTLRVLDDGTVSFEGTAGQLFSISDGLSGSIFSVNDISGIPSIEVLDTGLVKLNQYGGSTVFGASAAIQNSSSVNAKVSISTASASTPGLIVKGAASQTVNLQEWQDSSGTAYLSIGAPFSNAAGTNIPIQFSSGGNGQIKWGNNTVWGIGVITGQTNVMYPYATNRTALIIQGLASQTANLQEWQNSSGTVIAKVSSDGTITSGNITSTAYAFLTGTTYAYNVASAADYGATMMQFNSGKNLAITANTTITSQTTSTVGLIVKAIASQSANLQEWQDSSGASKAYLSINGHFVAQRVYAPDSLYVVSTGGPGTVNIETYANNGIGVIIKGKSSQTADLQQWQNSAGTVLAKLSAYGDFIIPDARVAIGASSVLANTFIFANTSYASYTPIVVRGAASQTANLTEWQNSVGTVLTKINSSGVLTAPAINIVGQSISSNITITSGYRYFVDTTAARTLTLPASPSVGDEIQIFDANNSASTYNITVDSNSAKIEGVVEQYLIDVNGAAVTMTYTGSTFGWKVRS
jgi:hypothetical protein